MQRDIELEEIPLTPDRYPSANYVTKLMRNQVYQIPDVLIPQTKTYEIEVRSKREIHCFRI